MSISTSSTALDGLVLYYPIVNIWSGTVMVSRETDLAAAKDQLPPEDLVSNGRKRIVDKAVTAPLLAMRKRVERLLKEHGAPMMGGVGVPACASATVEAGLAEIEASFYEHVETICQNLSARYLEHETLHPGWEEMLRRSHLTEDDVRARCRFDVVAIQPSAPTSSGAESRFGRFAEAAVPQILEDLAKRADKLLTDTFKGRVKATQRQLGAVQRLIEKLSNFSFLDPRVNPIAQSLDAQLAAMPATGTLTYSETATVKTVLKTLADPEFILAQGTATDDDSTDATDTDAELQPADVEAGDSPSTVSNDDRPYAADELPVEPTTAPSAPREKAVAHIGF